MDHWTEGQTQLPKPMRYITVITCMGVNVLGAISVTLLTVLGRSFPNGPSGSFELAPQKKNRKSRM